MGIPALIRGLRVTGEKCREVEGGGESEDKVAEVESEAELSERGRGVWTERGGV